MIETTLALASVVLAFASLAYAYASSREAKIQAELLKAQIEALKVQTDRVSNAALNLNQADYFALRTLVGTTGSAPVFDDHGNLDGYQNEDQYGSASVVFRKLENGAYLADVTLNNRPPGTIEDAEDPSGSSE